MADMDSEGPAAATGDLKRTWLSIFGGIGAGVLFVVVLIIIPYTAVLFLSGRFGGHSFLDADAPWVGVYNASLMLLAPMIQGVIAALFMGREKQGTGRGFAIICGIWLVQTLVAAVFIHEGVICLIMAAPLLLGLIGLGYAIGRWLAAWRRGRTVSVSLVPFIVLTVIAETSGPVPNHADVVVDSVTVNAPAEYVWKYVVDYPDNPNPPDYWLWQAGLPMPTHSVAPVQEVGARRDCKFTGNQAFEERIVALEPNRRLLFAVTRQPQHPEIIGHITVDKGEIRLVPNANGTTTIVATSWYRLHVRPATYFSWWAEDVTRHVHFRVLGYMKHLAERDYASARGKAA